MQFTWFRVVFSAFLLLFLGCEDSPKENVVIQEKKILENLSLSTNSGEILIVNQKAEQDKNDFASLENRGLNALRDLRVTGADRNIKILVFFTTWCDPCKGILPHLENLKNQFGNKIAFFGIPVDDLVGEVENFKGAVQVFSEENALNMPLILDENREELFKALGGIEGVPLIALYGENGEYIIHYLGAIPEEMIEFDLAQNLKQKEQ